MFSRGDRAAKKLKYPTSLKDLGKLPRVHRTVPTPIEARTSRTSAARAPRETVGKVLKRGDFVVYETTVYPGCTEEDCVPILERESGLKFNKDFNVGYTPERINPGDKEHRLPSIIKVTAGSTPEARTSSIRFIDRSSTPALTAHRASGWPKPRR